MKTILFFFLIASFIGCTDSPRKTKMTKAVRHVDSLNNITDSVDYCNACDSLDTWKGGIQGVDNSDSTGIYLFAECHTNKAYDLLFVPKGDIIKFKSSVTYDSLSRYYDAAQKMNYTNLDCYAFIIKKTTHKKEVSQDKDCDCEDLDTYDYVFPSSVQVFKKTDYGWVLIKIKEVVSFEQLGRVKLNTIFHID